MSIRLFSFIRLQTKGTFPPDLIVLVTLISSVGFVMLYSAAGGHWMPWALKQILRFIFGLGIFWIFSVVDTRFWLAQAFNLYGICLALLFGVELLGFVGMGARRWVDLYVFQLQPSELMKIALLLALAAYFHPLSHGPIKLRHLWVPALLVLIPAVLVLKQPDLGTAVILLLIGGMMAFLAGVRLWVFGSLFLVLAGVCPFFWTYLKPYQQKRILTFLDPSQDPLGSGYHILQSKIAIGSGGFWGKGFGHGTQSYLNFLPEKQTDFIFTMLCEEWGFLGAICLIVLYGLLLLRCVSVGSEAKYAFNRLLTLGVASMLFCHVFINMGMVMGILPVVGVPLPLMSYGGTSLLTLMMGFGLVASVSRQQGTRLPGAFSQMDS